MFDAPDLGLGQLPKQQFWLVVQLFCVVNQYQVEWYVPMHLVHKEFGNVLDGLSFVEGMSILKSLALS